MTQSPPGPGPGPLPENSRTFRLRRPSTHPPAPVPGAVDEDLGDPGPGDDRAYRASYFYEQLIDALVVFSSRYLRTATLLARRPSTAADRLLEELDQEQGRYTRPLAFLAISYLLFSALLAYLPWIIDVLQTGMLQAGPATESLRLTVPIDELVKGFGDIETDYLVVAVLAPLPAVILVSIISNLVANLLVAGSEYSRSRFSAMVQYAVGLGLFSMVWLILQTLVLLKVLVRLAEHLLVDGGGSGTLFLTVLFLGWGLVLTLATVALILGMATVPVWRLQKVLPDLARHGWLRRGALSLSGPLVLASTLVGIGGLVQLSDLLVPPPVRLHEAGRRMDGGQAVFDGAVQAGDDGPVAVLDWSLLWMDGQQDELRCESLTSAGRLPPRVTGATVTRPEVSLLSATAATLDDQRLLLEPGASAWTRIQSSVPLRENARPFELRRARICVRSSNDPASWIELRD